MPHVIHFVDLEEMIPELDKSEDSPVRASTVAVPVGSYSDMPDAIRVRTYLYVRQITRNNTVLSWCMPIGEIIDMMRGQPMDQTQQEKADEIWQQAEDIESLVHQRIKLEDEAFDIRAGIISIGSDEAITGYWSELESRGFQTTDQDAAENASTEEQEDEIPF